MEEQEGTLELKEIFHIILRRKKLICVITVLATVLSGVLSFFVIKPTYESETSIVVGRPESQSENEKLDNNDIIMYQNLIKTYTEIVTSKPVLDEAISTLDVKLSEEQLKKAIKVTSQEGTQILQIDITSDSANNAYKIANAITNSFIDKSTDIFPSSGVQLSIMDEAEVPKEPIKPKKIFNIIIAFVLGLFISIVIAFVLEYMDNTVKSEDDVIRYLEIPVIGIIPDQPDMKL